MVTKLAEGVWHIDLGGVNAYVLEDGDAITLVDTGMPWHADEVARALRTVAGSPGAVDRVLLTHYDLDHVGGFGRIDGLDAPVYAGEPDASYLTGVRRPPWASRKSLFQRVSSVGVRSPAGPVTAVGDDDSIGGFRAIHTPGHTPGHVAYVHEELSTAILGDLVRTADDRFHPSPWALSSDTDAVRRSINVVVKRAPPFDIGLVGHGKPIVGGADERFRQLA